MYGHTLISVKYQGSKKWLGKKVGVAYNRK